MIARRRPIDQFIPPGIEAEPEALRSWRTMVGLLTWPTYGTSLAGGGRGWFDRGSQTRGGPIPEPPEGGRPTATMRPRVRLDPEQQAVVISDLPRIAALRSFRLHLAVAAEDHVHILLSCKPVHGVPRLVQLIKGSLSRTLTVAAGDEPAATADGRRGPHHKWWARQYSFLVVPDRQSLQRVIEQLAAHVNADSAHCTLGRFHAVDMD